MEISMLNENLKRVILLRDEIKEMKKGGRHTYTLTEYIDQFRNMLISIDHGEKDRFWYPRYLALTNLDTLNDVEIEKINSAFSTYKRKLLGIVDRYIKEIQFGLLQHESKQNK